MTPDVPHVRNTLFLSLVEAFWGFGFNMVSISTVLPVFLEEQGARKWVIAFLPALAHLFAGLGQPVSGYLTRGRKSILGWMLALHFISPIPLGCIALCLTYGIGPTVPTVLIGWAVFFGLIGILFPMWIDFMARVLDPARRGRAFGVVFFMQTVSGIVGISITGLILARGTSLGHYALLFGITWAMLTGGSLFYLGTRGEQVPDLPPRRISLLGHLAGLLRLGWSTRWFRVYLPARTLVRGTFYLVVSFYAVHAHEVEGVSAAMAALFGTAALLSQALAGIALGFLGDHYGHKAPVILGQAFMVTAGVLVLLPLPGPAYFIVAFLTGVFMASEFAGQNNWLIDLGGPENRQSFISLTGFLVTPFAVAATIGGGALMDRFGFPPVAFGVACAFLIAMALEWIALPARPAQCEGERR